MHGPDFIQRHMPKWAEPLDLGFNIATMALARAMLPKGWRIEDCEIFAPQSLPELNRAIQTEGMVVWGGASDKTIYACPEHNAAARAWHDAVHWRHQLPFTVAGEAACAYVQAWQLLQRYGHEDEVEEWVAILLTEVIGQQVRSIQTGEFPDDQRAFTNANLPHWRALAGRICIALGEDATERDALALAAEHFGEA